MIPIFAAVNKFGNVDLSEKQPLLKRSDDDSFSLDQATSAIVTIHLAMENVSFSSTALSSSNVGLRRPNMKKQLREIAANCQVKDCLLAGEVLWCPEDRSEVLTREEVDADYPELLPL